MTSVLLLTLVLVAAAVFLAVARRGQSIQRARDIEEAARRAVQERLQRSDPDSRA